MTLAALLLVHRYPEQAETLINTLLSYGHITVHVHTDLKAPDVFEHLKQKFQDNKRVILVSERYKVFWGSYGQIKATAALMHSANKSAPDYAFLLSGQDFPIRPISDFVNFLTQQKGKEFLVHFRLPDAQWELGGLQRLQYFHFDSEKRPWLARKVTGLLHRFQNLVGYKRPLSFTCYGGSNWFTITGSTLQLACTKLTANPNFLKRFKYSRCADEVFLQSLVVEELPTDTFVNSDLRMIDWATGPEYPRIWRSEDFERLTSADNRFFARKFDATVDSDILRKLQAHVTK
jgi:hypothetical protein